MLWTYQRCELKAHSHGLAGSAITLPTPENQRHHKMLYGLAARAQLTPHKSP
jgi:hypothetical protein